MKTARIFSAVNPAPGEPLEPTYTEATHDEIDQAVREAEAAFVLYEKRAVLKKRRFWIASRRRSWPWTTR